MQKLIKLILTSKLPLFLAIACTIFVGFLSLADVSEMPNLEVKNEDKLYHMTAYFVLNTFWLVALIRYSLLKISFNIIVSLSVIGLGIIIEVLQDKLTSYRTFDYYDILANASGVLLSLICFEFFSKIIFKNITLKRK
jgi:VanZ family protein